ncbi:MAG: ribonuclease HI family protein [Pseudomonadota bacterium]
MDQFERLREAAFKVERVAARRLSERSDIGEQQALHDTLALAAGARGLEALLAERAALRDLAAARSAQREAQRQAAQSVRNARHDGAPTPWRAWFDGSAHPNPGRCGIGALLTGPLGERIEISQAAGHGNSGEAEYRALIAVLGAAVRAGAHALTVYGDSRVVVDDVTGTRPAAAALSELRNEAQALLAQLREVSLRWIPRHKNGAADALSQRAAREP